MGSRRDYEDGSEYKPEYQPLAPDQPSHVPVRTRVRGNWRNEVYRYVLMPVGFGVVILVLVLLLSVCGR